MVLAQVFLEPMPMACSAASGRVKTLETMGVMVGLLLLCLLSVCRLVNQSWANAKVSVDCAGGLISANSFEKMRPFGRTLKLLYSNLS